MNANLSYTLESSFGPCSELVDVSAFLDASSTSSQDTLPHHGGNVAPDIVEECSVSDIKKSLEIIWDNPTLSGHLIREHDRTVTALYSLNQKPTKSYRKSNIPDADSLAPEVADVQKSMDVALLDSLKLNSDALLFMRTPKNSDQNVLQTLKYTPNPSIHRTSNDALITISIYNRIPWGPSYVSRLSQHVFLSSNTLGDIYTAIPCISKSYPQHTEIGDRENCFILIEGKTYGDGGPNDYAGNLIQHLRQSTKKKKAEIEITRAETSAKDTKLSSLSMRVGEPYWLVHQGNCEHFCVVDQIRRAHPSDPTDGYPITIQVTPPILDLCRACTKVPATWSIVGDRRLGESPCPLCGPCWRCMGDADDFDGILALPLPSYPTSIPPATATCDIVV